MKHRISKGKLLIICTLSLLVLGISANAARTPDAADDIDSISSGSPWWYSSPAAGSSSGHNRTGGIFVGRSPADMSPTAP